MIDINDFIVKETLRKTPRYIGEVNKNKYYRCKCPSCGYDLGYISKNQYKLKTYCNKCSVIKREQFAKNHWSKNGGTTWNKGLIDPTSKLRVKIGTNLRSRLNKAIKGNYKAGSAVKDLGCSIDEFKVYMENLFEEGMTWDNWGRKGWHIDHKIALAKFDLSKPEEFKKATHYTNLQPLWAKDNLKKGAS